MAGSTTGEIIDGLWRFEAFHPDWAPDESGEDGWERQQGGVTGLRRTGRR